MDGYVHQSMGQNADSCFPDLLSFGRRITRCRRNSGAGPCQVFDRLGTNRFGRLKTGPANGVSTWSTGWYRCADLGDLIGLGFYIVSSILFLPTGPAACERNDVRLLSNYGLQLCNRVGSIAFGQPMVRRSTNRLDRTMFTQCLFVLRLRAGGTLDGLDRAKETK